MKSPVKIRKSISPREKKVYTGLTVFLGVVSILTLSVLVVAWDTFTTPGFFFGCGIISSILTIICVFRLKKVEVVNASSKE